MLKTVPLKEFGDKQARIESWDPRNESWIVSDLQSKWELQKLAIDRIRAISDSAVLRTTDLWRRLAQIYLPDLEILSPELAVTLFGDWIHQRDLPWAKSAQSVQLVMQQIQRWLVMYSDPHHEAALKEWFAEHPESFAHWGHWYYLGQEIWERCQAERLALPAWLPALLLQFDLSNGVATRKLIFDLGPQISPVEMALIERMARFVEVEILIPNVPWQNLMPRTLEAYQSFLPTFKGENWHPRKSGNIDLFRFTTQLNEVKNATHMVRKWLDEGIVPANIAIVAPDIEEYWPALSLYLEQEGIPVQKSRVYRWSATLEFGHWLAALKLAIQKVNSAHLEVALFSANEPKKLKYSDFRRLFARFYDENDLRRAQQIWDFNLPHSSMQLDVAGFMTWACSYWSAHWSLDGLEKFVDRVLKETPRNLKLSIEQWLSYCEGVISRREQSLVTDQSEGIHCMSLTSTNWLRATHVVLVNLVDSALRYQIRSPMSESEASRLSHDLGYPMGPTDRQEVEFELLWFLHRPWKAIVASVANASFSGGSLSPSRWWLWYAIESGFDREHVSQPGSTRWDELQSADLKLLSQARVWPQQRMSTLMERIREDKEGSENPWPALREVRLSTSFLEQYWKCPFIYTATRLLKLSDEPALDLDLDPRVRGRFMHKMIEKWTEVHGLKLGTEEGYRDFLNQLKVDENLELGDERLWPGLRERLLRELQGVMKFELVWREKFPTVQTVATERGFRAYWSDKGRNWTDQETEVKLSGRIDRIDRDSRGRFAVVDYKSSGSNLRYWKSWLKNDMVQMPVYMEMLEKGFCGLPPGDVVAAEYFEIRNPRRKVGLQLTVDSPEFYSEDDRNRSALMTEDDKKMLLDQSREMIAAAIHSMRSGELKPKPKNRKTCETCDWRRLCRAPHLN